jgi:hypothetical protein
MSNESATLLQSGKRTRTKDCLQIVQRALDDGTLEEWARAGATDKELAYYLGIGKDSYIKAKKALPDLIERIQRARSPLVPEAFNSMVRLAHGFNYTESVEEVKEVIYQGEIIKLHTWTTYTKYQAPNINAIARVIVNYQKQQRDGVEGVPTFYITEQPQGAEQNKNGKLERLDNALYELFFGEHKKEEQED